MKVREVVGIKVGVETTVGGRIKVWDAAEVRVPVGVGGRIRD
jgi:hypothetical protein